MTRKSCHTGFGLLACLGFAASVLLICSLKASAQQQVNDNVQARPKLRRQSAVQIDDEEDEVIPVRANPQAHHQPSAPQKLPPSEEPRRQEARLSSSINPSVKRVMLTIVSGSVILPPALRAYGPRLVEEGRVTLDGGRYVGFLRDNFEFTIPSVEPGSYLVDVDFPALLFQPLRVDVNSKGKARSRQVDLQMIRTNEELKAPYPLKIYAVDRTPYFAKREQWRITDIFLNPMVLMMLVPAVLMYIVPKMQQSIDPEAQQEMARLQGQSPMDMVSNLLGGGGGGSTGGGSKPAVKSSAESGNNNGASKQGTNGDDRERRKRRERP